MGIPLGAPLPRPKHSGRSLFQQVTRCPRMCFVQGTGEASTSFSPSFCLCVSIPLAIPPSLSLHIFLPSPQAACTLPACSVPLPLCRSRSCHPTPQAPHPWENGAGSPVVISIRSPFQHLSTQPTTCWLCSPLSSWHMPSSSPFCLMISNFQDLCPGKSCNFSEVLQCPRMTH